MIIEDLMLDLMYDLPSTKKVKECVVTREVVLDREQAHHAHREGRAERSTALARDVRPLP